MEIMFRGKLVKNLEVDGIDMNDFPDFCDAYFVYGEYSDGYRLSDEDLNDLRDENPDFLNAFVHDLIQGEV